MHRTTHDRAVAHIATRTLEDAALDASPYVSRSEFASSEQSLDHHDAINLYLDVDLHLKPYHQRLHLTVSFTDEELALPDQDFATLVEYKTSLCRLAVNAFIRRTIKIHHPNINPTPSESPPKPNTKGKSR